MKYKISQRKLSWIRHRQDIMCNKPNTHFREENFYEWHQICKIRESFLSRKFPAIQYASTEPATALAIYAGKKTTLNSVRGR